MRRRTALANVGTKVIMDVDRGDAWEGDHSQTAEKKTQERELLCARIREQAEALGRNGVHAESQSSMTYGAHPTGKPTPRAPKPLEADDDPYRLARLFIEN